MVLYPRHHCFQPSQTPSKHQWWEPKNYENAHSWYCISSLSLLALFRDNRKSSQFNKIFYQNEFISLSDRLSACSILAQIISWPNQFPWWLWLLQTRSLSQGWFVIRFSHYYVYTVQAVKHRQITEKYLCLIQKHQLPRWTVVQTTKNVCLPFVQGTVFCWKATARHCSHTRRGAGRRVGPRGWTALSPHCQKYRGHSSQPGNSS